jgi:glucose dehydrogenase
VFHTGAVRTACESHREFTFEATPLKVRDELFFCTPHTDVIAVDADTGKEFWRFSRNVNLEGDTYLSCRGVSYYAVPGASGACAYRILNGTPMLNSSHSMPIPANAVRTLAPMGKSTSPTIWARSNRATIIRPRRP